VAATTSPPDAGTDGGAGAADHGETGVSEEAEADGVDRGTVRKTRRWHGIVAVILLSVAVGVLAKRPSLLLVGAVAVAFAAYPHLMGPPEVDLSVDRAISPESPTAGDTVEVTTTVRNEGDEPLFDVRLIDGVPPMATVEDGTPRLATALGPGEAATLEYDIEIDRTTHRFRPTTAIVRDPSGGTEVETTVVEETVIEGVGHVPEVPLRTRSQPRSGRLLTDQGGSGIEFHRTREYEPGDPANRIDWRQYARTGELSSIDFREERLAEVVVCVDARPAAYRAPSPTEAHAVAYSIGSAARIGEALFAANHHVGLAAFGRELCWLPPGGGNDHEDRYFHRLATDPAFEVVPPETVEDPSGDDSQLGRAVSAAETDDHTTMLDILLGSDDEEEETVGSSLESQLSTVRSQIDPETQVLLLSPLSDDGASRIAQLLESAGAAVTVISTDVTTDESLGGRLARIERKNRVHALRNAGVPVVDWDPEDRLGTSMALAGGRGA
jgi:uncharacterized repeat protein (TIGR01451 family)